MRNLKLFCCLLCVCLLLCACEVQTPGGTLTIGFDETKKSEQTKIIDQDGNETVIDTSNLTGFVDRLLDDVALPNGASTAELKEFVYGTIGSLGIDLTDIDNSEQIEQTIRDALEEKGVDTTDMEIDVEEWLAQEGVNEGESK